MFEKKKRTANFHSEVMTLSHRISHANRQFIPRLMALQGVKSLYGFLGVLDEVLLVCRIHFSLRTALLIKKKTKVLLGYKFLCVAI